MSIVFVTTYACIVMTVAAHVTYNTSSLVRSTMQWWLSSSLSDSWCPDLLPVVWHADCKLSHIGVAAKPVSDATLASWKGFVTLIVNGYMKQRLAWFPIDRLQMEITAVTGRTERPHDVAEWARIVQTTLTQVAPQFPSQ